jgi:hypothetical protein
MRTLALLVLVVAACGGTPKKPEVSKTEDVASDVCCCKSNPATSEDGKAIFATGNRMECSTKQGTCVGDNECVVTP